MGGDSSKMHSRQGMSPEMTQYVKGYMFLRSEREPTLGQVQIYKKSGTKDFLIYKKIIFDTEEDARDFIADLREVRQVHHANILPIAWSNCKNLKKHKFLIFKTRKFTPCVVLHTPWK